MSIGMENKLTDKQRRFHIHKRLKAMRELLRHFGVVKEPLSIENKKLVMLAMCEIQNDNLPVPKVAALTIILDYLFPEWRNFLADSYKVQLIPRDSKEMRIWIKEVKDKHNYKCANCASKKNLSAHHLMPWAKYPELRIDINNGIALCGECHHKEHPEMGKGMFVKN